MSDFKIFINIPQLGIIKTSAGKIVAIGRKVYSSVSSVISCTDFLDFGPARCIPLTDKPITSSTDNRFPIRGYGNIVDRMILNWKSHHPVILLDIPEANTAIITRHGDGVSIREESHTIIYGWGGDSAQFNAARGVPQMTNAVDRIDQ